MGDRIMPPPARGAVRPRQKFAVKPGFSMLDWNLLKTRAKNLSGRDEESMRGITKAEVKKHNTEHDCWSIFRGKVYNLTPFLHYHPGGVAEVMKGAGRDCTALFDKYHPWVNFDSLAGHLYIGPLVKEEKTRGTRKDAARGVPDEKDSVAATGDEDPGKSDKQENGDRDGMGGLSESMKGMSAAGREELARAESEGAP